MSPFDLLSLFAELAVSYVGFAAIIAAVHSLGGRRWAALDRLVFRILIEGSIAGLFLSLVPLLLEAVGVGEATTWTASSFVSLCTGLTAGLMRSRQNRRVLGRQPKIGLFVGMPVAVVGVALNAGNIAVWRAPTPYLVVMFLWMIMVSAMFLTLVIRLFPLAGGATPGSPERD